MSGDYPKDPVLRTLTEATPTDQAALLRIASELEDFIHRCFDADVLERDGRHYVHAEAVSFYHLQADRMRLLAYAVQRSTPTSDYVASSLNAAYSRAVKLARWMEKHERHERAEREEQERDQRESEEQDRAYRAEMAAHIKARPQDFFTRAKAATFLGITREAIDQLTAQEKLSFLYRDERDRPLCDLDELEDYRDGGHVGNSCMSSAELADAIGLTPEQLKLLAESVYISPHNCSGALFDHYRPRECDELNELTMRQR